MDADHILEILRSDAPEVLRAFVERLPDNPFASTTLEILGSGDPAADLVALVALTGHFCRQEPELGAALARAAHTRAVELYEVGGPLPANTAGIYAALFVEAAMALGRHEEVVDFTEKWTPRHQGVADAKDIATLSSAGEAARRRMPRRRQRRSWVPPGEGAAPVDDTMSVTPPAKAKPEPEGAEPTDPRRRRRRWDPTAEKSTSEKPRPQRRQWDPDAEGGEAVGAVEDMETPEGEPVRFTVYHPKEVPPDSWQKLLAYVHIPSVEAEVEKDRAKRLAREPVKHVGESGTATQLIPRRKEITIRPHLPGFRFKPTSQSIEWIEDFEVAEFEMKATEGVRLERPVVGSVEFYVDPLLVGAVEIWTSVSEDAAPDPEPSEQEAGDPYDAIFVSYSRDDGAMVSLFGSVIKAMGNEFLRDVEFLRSGEEWNPALLKAIDRADVFQLFWSETASRSGYVEQEWRHALARDEPGFIRPLYWEKPLVQPPEELGHLNFTYYDRPDDDE